MSQLALHPYLFFPGNCHEAMNYYQSILGGKLQILKADEEAEKRCPSMKGKVMHSCLQLDSGNVLQGSDDPNNSQVTHSGFSLSITAKSVEEGEKLFQALSNDGKVTMAFGKTSFSAGFGTCKDKYGVGWMVYVCTGNQSVSTTQ
ncbi:hypothetical protein FDP41_005927 [Naegleria fowleri]|uniref:PhnB-like domain-containing protein n=1 Tax=Naegleria fowleri TaxID=5763 RepID=A0A6A5BM71_NAEFO|nr:uncharacterized protein FDP41_005927 [Naegleria fowleri]KAF0975174.1 hypothetical protein FDP41_005927 [Naegleria fowleri]CAG4719166.1 unnamed protein product [Naegleria fowleri]